MTESENPGAGVREYLKAAGCLAIYALRAGDKTTFGCSADPWAAASAGGAQLVEPIWIMGKAEEGAQAAAKALDAFSSGAPGTWSSDVDGRAGWSLALVASEIYAAPHARIMTFVRHAVGVIDAEYERMMRTGDMKPINRSYKAARLAGVKLPPFGQFKEDYRLKMVRDAARTGILRAAFR